MYVCEFTIAAGNIANNTATTRGGGVYVYRPTLNMNGGTITENSADEGGGVYVEDGGTFTMNGSATVNSNNDIYLKEDDDGTKQMITVTGDLDAGAGALNITPGYTSGTVVHYNDDVSLETWTNNFALNTTWANQYGLGLNKLGNDLKVQTTYLVKFYNVSAVLETQEMFIGDLLTEPVPAPTWDHHTFNGWNNTSVTGPQWNFGSDKVAANTELHANWTAEQKIPVKFYNVSDVVDTQEMFIGDLLTEPTAPTWDHHTFNGWNNTSVTGPQWNFGSDKVAANTELHANWTAEQKIPVKFYNVSAVLETQEMFIGDLLTEPTAPTWDHHTFNGWNNTSVTGPQWNFGSDKVAANTELHANWTAEQKIPVKFYNVSAVLETQEMFIGDLLTEPTAPTWDHHTFNGWNNTSVTGPQWNFGSDKVAANTELHANWTAEQKIPVKFYNVSAVLETQEMFIGDLLTEPTAPTWDHHTFNGWNNTSVTGPQWNFGSDKVAANTELHANWTAEQKIPVKFYNVSAVLETQEMFIGDLLTEPTAPTWDHHTFNGWNNSSVSGTPWNFAVDVVNEGTILYANWTAEQKIPVKFYNESVVVDTQEKFIGELLTEPVPAPTWDHHTFNGWNNTSVSGTPWNFAVDVVNAGTSLFANWTAEQKIPVKFYNESAVLETQNVFIGDRLTEPTAPSWDHHTFNGWNNSSVSGTPWNFAVDVVNEGTILYANWTAEQKIPVKFYNESVVVDTQEKFIGELLTEPVPAPTWDHHTFNGWNNTSVSGTPWNFAVDVVNAGTSLFANWTAEQKIPVKFYNESAVLETQNVFIGDRLTEPTAPTWDHHTFNGWNNSSVSGTPWNFAGDVVNAGTSLYANWTAEQKIPVKFYNESAVLETQNVFIGDRLTEPVPAPTWDHHTFNGWNNSSVSGTPWNFAVDVVNAGTILFANWTAEQKIPVKFYNESDVLETQNVFIGDRLTEPTAPTWDHHTFNGWNNTSVTGPQWNFGSDKVAANTELHANWTAEQKIPVKFYNVSDVVDTQEMFIGDLLTEPTAPTWDHHTFNGWNNTSVTGPQWNFGSDKVAANTELHANWTAEQKIPVKFYNVSAVLETQEMFIGDLLTEPTAPTWDHHTFNGWNNTSVTGPQWNFGSDKVAANTELHANWTAEQKIHVKFYNVSAVLETQEMFIGDLLTEPTAPTWDHHTFNGWNNTSVTGPQWNFGSDKVAANTELHANWTAEQKIPVKFYNVSAVVDTQEMFIGDLLTEPTAPTWDHHTFNGWNNTSVTGPQWNFGSDKVAANTELHANWTAEQTYLVEFFNGTTSVEQQNKFIGDLVTAPADPTWDHHTFNGWNVSSETGTPWIFGTTTVTAATNLYANWTAIPYLITFYKDATTEHLNYTKFFGDKLIKPTVDPTRTGYTFTGWYNISDSVTPWNFSTKTIVGNTNIFANWTAEQKIPDADDPAPVIPITPAPTVTPTKTPPVTPDPVVSPVTIRTADTGEMIGTFTLTGSPLMQVSIAGDITQNAAIVVTLGLPNGVQPAPGVEYQSFEITTDGISSDALGTMTFSIPLDELARAGFGTQDVALWHYADGIWTQLPTYLSYTENGNAVYISMTDEYSPFAITYAKGATSAGSIPESSLIKTQVPTEIPTNVPTGTPTKAPASPLPIVGILAGLCIAIGFRIKNT